MVIPFHTIWLGRRPPLRALDNLYHLLDLNGADPTGSAPLLWLDHSAWNALLQQPPVALQPYTLDQLPPATVSRYAALGLPPATPVHWLQIKHKGTCHLLPVLLLEELTAQLQEPWQNLEAAIHTLKSLAHSSAGAHVLQQELDLADPAATPLLRGPELFAYLHTLLIHAQRHWANHGLLCLASDLLRLLALAWLPGSYGDLGDIAGRLHSIPAAADAGPAGFCAHHTVAIENDLILATNPATLQAITLATALWSWRCVRGIAERLGISKPHLSPAEQLQAVLPHLDQHLPPLPSLSALFQPPWTQLADYINLAYGAQPLFHSLELLAPFTAGRRGKELLINDIGGFTGYQKAAHHLLPDNAINWARYANSQQLLDYAPQLGWKTYGFGTIDQLIDLGQRLVTAAPSAAAARHNIALLADSFPLAPRQLESIALLGHQLHHLLSYAHFNPQQRSSSLAQVEQLCSEFQLPR